MKFLLKIFSIAIIASSFAFSKSPRKCVGEEFFSSKWSESFWMGLNGICMDQLPLEASKILRKNLPSIENYWHKLNPKRISEKLEVWRDSSSLEIWGGENTRLSLVEISGYSKEVFSKYKISAKEIGSESIYIGNREKSDTIMAFNFYVGRSRKFRTTNFTKYSEQFPVNGLYHIIFNLDGIKSAVFEMLLDSTYISACDNSVSENCFTSFGSWINLKLNSPYVGAMLYPYDNGKLYIYYSSDVSNGFTNALHENVKTIIDKSIQSRRSQIELRMK